MRYCKLRFQRNFFEKFNSGTFISKPTEGNKIYTGYTEININI